MALLKHEGDIGEANPSIVDEAWHSPPCLKLHINFAPRRQTFHGVPGGDCIANGPSPAHGRLAGPRMRGRRRGRNRPIPVASRCYVTGEPKAPDRRPSPIAAAFGVGSNSKPFFLQYLHRGRSAGTYGGQRRCEFADRPRLAKVIGVLEFQRFFRRGIEGNEKWVPFALCLSPRLEHGVRIGTVQLPAGPARAFPG